MVIQLFAPCSLLVRIPDHSPMSPVSICSPLFTPLQACSFWKIPWVPFRSLSVARSHRRHRCLPCSMRQRGPFVLLAQPTAASHWASHWTLCSSCSLCPLHSREVSHRRGLLGRSSTRCIFQWQPANCQLWTSTLCHCIGPILIEGLLHAWVNSTVFGTSFNHCSQR